MYILLLLELFFFHIGIIMISMGGAGMLEIGSLFCLFSTILIPVFRGLHHECLEAILRKS